MEDDERSERRPRDPRDERGRREAPSEGVRILGAQEAAEVEAQRVGGRDRPGSRPGDARGAAGERDDAARAARAARPFWPDEGPSWSGADTGETGEGATGDRGAGGGDDFDDPLEAIVEPPSGETAVELPHWTEPPTGQVPAVLGGEQPGDDALDVWSTLSGAQPRYRAEGADWADADFSEALAAGDEPREGALADHAPDVADDDDAFVDAVRKRRRSGARRVVTSTPPARPAAARPARRNAAAGDMLPSGGRDLNVAVLSALIVAAIAVVAFVAGPGTTAVLAAVVLAMCSLELANALHEKGLRPAVVPVVAASAAMPIAAYHYAGYAAFPVVLTLVTVTSMIAYLWQVAPGRAMIGVATSIATFAYVGGLGGYAGLLLARPDGVGLLIGVVLCVIAYDVAGYFVGSQFGHSAIAPRVSPNKTVEGTLAGVGAAVVAALVILPRFAPWDQPRIWQVGALGLLIGVAALLGDLCESMLKRDLGVKDFGTVLPGHGGFLDRFDGLLFALPVAFYVALEILKV